MPIYQAAKNLASRANITATQVNKDNGATSINKIESIVEKVNSNPI